MKIRQAPLQPRGCLCETNVLTAVQVKPKSHAPLPDDVTPKDAQKLPAAF